MRDLIGVAGPPRAFCESRNGGWSIRPGEPAMLAAEKPLAGILAGADAGKSMPQVFF